METLLIGIFVFLIILLIYGNIVYLIDDCNLKFKTVFKYLLLFLVISYCLGLTTLYIIDKFNNIQ